MSGNQLKTPLSKSLPNAIQGKILDAMQLVGKNLPCHVVAVDGAIVTVSFDITSDYTLPNVTMPLFGPEYIRYPIQVGCKGFAIAADARLGGNSGLGSGVSDLSQPANLSALMFMPFGNTAWSSVDANAVVIYGPNGVVIRDSGSGAVITLTPSGINCEVGSSIFNITSSAIEATSATITLNGVIVLNGPITQTNTGGGSTTATIIGPLNVTNDVTANGTSVHTHVHSGVQTGSGDSGPPV
jgi:hypothetical protein